MNNALQVRDNWDVSEFTDEELELIQQKINERKIKVLTNKVEQMEHNISQLKENTDIKITEISNKFDDLKDDNEKKLEVAINKYRVDKNKWGFESQSDFGIRFRVSIGSKTVGKLFKIVGLAKSSKGKTEPYRQAIINGCATTEVMCGYESVRWHHEKCLKQVEKWLSENNLLETFYSFDQEKDLMCYINELYKQYCE